MADTKDYYSILGVGKSASADELKRAYRKLALQWHPDRHQGTDKKQAEEKFKEINKAYEVLSNPQKKQTYDQFGRAAFEQSGYGSAAGGASPFAGGFQQGPFTYTEDIFGGFSDPFEIFEQFFGGGASPFGGRSRQRKPVYAITIDFMEAVQGVEKEVSIDGNKRTIKIPAGVDDHTRIRFSEFDLMISVRPSRQFQRKEQDIYIDFPISFATAALGDTIEIPTIDGTITLKIRPGTQPNTLVRLRGRGVPYPNSRGRGDQYVRILIHVPANLTRRQKELLREFEE